MKLKVISSVYCPGGRVYVVDSVVWDSLIEEHGPTYDLLAPEEMSQATQDAIKRCEDAGGRPFAVVCAIGVKP